MRRRTLLTTALAAGAVTMPGQPASAASATRFGVIASTQGPPKDDADTFRRLYEKQRALYGDGPIGIRLFAADRLPLAGDGSMVGTLLAWATASHPDEPITISHKTRDDDRLRALLDWAHEHHTQLSVIYFHEVQNDWGRRRDPRAEPAAYLDVYRAYRRIIGAHPARSQVTLEKNLMWYWQHYNVKKLGGDWRLFVERNDDPADLVSWDTYVFPGMPPTLPHSNQGRYATPASSSATRATFGVRPSGRGESARSARPCRTATE
ncbi:hypothetical protein [Actinoplanes flavus]|uniref:GH26 domain-containing protein n=1 Tax=Actinoplanes flavus TaxID=2820290 RepID=A0ABS3UK85_9ACTN|nr:hypothetical protein [Actinoplanes flavus]MBO3739192.1 hypothetical protein [Actinoplanes flavus]